MIIANDEKFVFVHIPRTGGTSVTVSLKDALVANYDYWEIVIKDCQVLNQHALTQEIECYLSIEQEWSNYKKLTLVREPKALLKSCYAYGKQVLIDNPDIVKIDRRLVFAPFIWAGTTDIDFDKYIEIAFGNDYEFMISQYTRLNIDLFQQGSGLIVDTTQINDRWDEILDYLNLPRVPLQWVNDSDTSGITMRADTESLIENNFAPDYAHLPGITGAIW